MDEKEREKAKQYCAVDEIINLILVEARRRSRTYLKGATIDVLHETNARVCTIIGNMEVEE